MPTKRVVAVLLALVIAMTVPIVFVLRRDDRAGDPFLRRPGATFSPSRSPSFSSSAVAAHGADQRRWPGYAAWRVYAGPEGAEGNDSNFQPSVSGNGRWIAFASDSSNLVRGDTNRAIDIFVKDRATGRTTRVSVSSSGRQANKGSFGPAISENGRLVAFGSHASNLVSGDTNRCRDLYNENQKGCPDVFVHDQLTHSTTRVSISTSGRQGSGASGEGLITISADGRYVAFHSRAANLVAGDTNGKQDVFIRDRELRRTIRVSVSSDGRQADGDSSDPAISRDGARVAFVSFASNLGARGRSCSPPKARPFPCSNVYLRDIGSGNTSVVAATSKDSRSAAISGDGRSVAFVSGGDDLVPGDTNDEEDVFLFDVANSRTTRISISSSEAEANEGSYERPAVSIDGRFVAFASGASNLIPDDTEMCEDLMDDVEFSCSDIFLRDRAAGTTELASISTAGDHGELGSWNPAMSSDGRYIAISSSAIAYGIKYPTGCGDDICPHVFVRDRSARTTTLVSTSSPGGARRPEVDGYPSTPAVSSDGSVVAFVSDGTKFVADTNGSADVFVWRRGRISRVSVSSGGEVARGWSNDPALSADGRVVAFRSKASNLVRGDTNAVEDVFVRDMERHRTTRVSVSSSGAQADKPSAQPSLSEDGRYVVFTSDATNLVTGDTNHVTDVFVHDRVKGDTVRVSVGDAGKQADGASSLPSISLDGTRVAFESDARNLGTGGDPSCGTCGSSVFVRDLAAGRTILASVSSEGTTGFVPAISGNGTFVAFLQVGGNDPGAVPPSLYRRDIDAGRTVRVDLPARESLSISFDGRYIASWDVTGDTGFADVEAGRRIFVTRCGSPVDASLASGGRFLVFSTECGHDAEDRNRGTDIYLFDRETRRMVWVSRHR